MSNSTQDDLLLPWLDKLLGSVELVSIVVGITLNSLTLRYFFQRRQQLSNLLFFLIAINDLVILVTCSVSAICLLSDRRPVLFAYRAVCILTGFLFNIASRLSVFLIALLALARAICLVSPFRLSRKKWPYLVPLGVYVMLNVALASLPLIFSKKQYHFVATYAQCSWGINELSFVGGDQGVNYTTTWYGMTYATIIVPWFFPAVIVIISCAMSLKALLKSSRRRRNMTASIRDVDTRSAAPEPLYTRAATTDNNRQKRRHKGSNNLRSSNHHATMTIVIATVVYIVFNVPCWVFNASILIALRSTNHFFGTTIGIYVAFFMGQLSVALNSASNPIIYFCRMKGLRDRTKDTLCSRFYSVRMTQSRYNTSSACSPSRMRIKRGPTNSRLNIGVEKTS